MSAVPGVEIRGELRPGYADILTPEALQFVAALTRQFRPRRHELMALRRQRQARIDAGQRPDFLAETRAIREGSWTIAGIPADLQDRRVEITGPVDRKMIINALNSGAKCFMADFEDSASPTWELMIGGQINLRDAINRSISFEQGGKQYRLNEKVATLIVRPRGWHLIEKHLLVDGEPAIGGIVDFALYFFHNARTLLAKGTGPYFYLPKMQSHLEAALWNDIFNAAQDALGIPRKTIKVTVLIETLWAAFEMDEILHALKDHIVALNCGRWDYIFSCIKTLNAHGDWVVPDRLQVTMDKHFLDSYSKLLCQTTHRRGAMAMGGMAAFIPTKDAAKNEEVFAKVRADKLREVKNGHDGTWVAHPALVPIALAVFDEHMPTPNQLHKQFDYGIQAADLLRKPEGAITEAGLRNNINVGIGYTEAWIRGVGCVPLHNLMEDAATAEISRTQVWQWLKYGAAMADGRTVTRELILRIIDEELASYRRELGEERYYAGRFAEAAGIMARMSTAAHCEDFLTLPSYSYLD
ncbi:MAG TPA: malate synthase A [Nevskiaceae bacterium]|nr:malate synthase A [Nevskiaceae bacterium]